MVAKAQEKDDPRINNEFASQVGFINGIKIRHPRFIFTFLMALETINFASDTAQLINVVNEHKGYYSYPYVDDRSFEYSAVWSIVKTSKSPNFPFLAFTLPWYGLKTSSYGEYSEGLEHKMECLTQGKHCKIQFSSRSSQQCTSWPRSYNSTGTKFSQKRVDNSIRVTSDQIGCILITDVFTAPFINYSPCPNPLNAIFDDKSYYVRNGASIPFNATIENYYIPNWHAKVRSVNACTALQSIYNGTIAVYTFECFTMLLQLIVSVRILCSFRSRVDYIRAIVEFPLVGFLFMSVFLTESDVKRYALIDYEIGQKRDLGQILGSSRNENFLNTKVKTNIIVSPNCGKEQDFVYLGQAIIYPFYLPFTQEFRVAITPSSTFFKYLFFLSLYVPILIAGVTFGLGIFSANLPLLFTMAVAYGDRVYVSRFIHDFPNLAMAISYMVNVEKVSQIPLLSSLLSGVLIVYYTGGVVTAVWRELGKPSSFTQLYGPLTGYTAMYLIFIQPLVTYVCYCFYLPMILCGCRCFVYSLDSHTEKSASMPASEREVELHQRSQQKSNASNDERSRNYPASSLKCEYYFQDNAGVIQGPHSSSEMRAWFMSCYFSPTVQIKPSHFTNFYPLGSLFPVMDQAFTYVPAEHGYASGSSFRGSESNQQSLSHNPMTRDLIPAFDGPRFFSDQRYSEGQLQYESHDRYSGSGRLAHEIEHQERFRGQPDMNSTNVHPALRLPGQKKMLSGQRGITQQK